MPLKNDIKKILVIGNGDKTGKSREDCFFEIKVCRSFSDEGFEVALLTAKKPSLMLTSFLSNSVHHLSFTIHSIIEVIEKESPDAVFPLLDDFQACRLMQQLARKNYRFKKKIRWLGPKYNVFELALDQSKFSQLADQLELPRCRGRFASSVDEANKAMQEFGGFPLILRSRQFKGIEIAGNEKELYYDVLKNIEISPRKRVWIEECVEGRKEIEMGVIRDSKGEAAVIFEAENIDPVGIHSGDSVVISPSQTLTNSQLEKLKHQALKLAQTLDDFTGYCSLHFAVKSNKEPIILGIDFSMRRISALVTLMAGYQVSKIVTKLAIGYTIRELDHLFGQLSNQVLLKVPHFKFDNKGADEVLNAQMQSVGSTIYAGKSFNEVLSKVWRASEISDLMTSSSSNIDPQKLRKRLLKPYPNRLQNIYQAFKIGTSVDEIEEITQIDRCFLEQIKAMVDLEVWAKQQALDSITVKELSNLRDTGFSDHQIAKMLSKENQKVTASDARLKTELKVLRGDIPTKMTSRESDFFCFKLNGNKSSGGLKKRERILMLSSDSIVNDTERDEITPWFFIREAKRIGYEIIILSSNPHSIPWLIFGDKLYLEPRNWENVYKIYQKEKPKGVFIHQASSKKYDLAKRFKQKGVKIFDFPSKVSEEIFI